MFLSTYPRSSSSLHTRYLFYFGLSCILVQLLVISLSNQPCTRNAFVPFFIFVNVAAYLFELGIVVLWKCKEGFEDKLWLASTVFVGALFLAVSIGFICAGCRVYKLLEKVPVHRDILRPKLREVGIVTAVCGICFSSRFVLDLYLAVQYLIGTDLPSIPLLWRQSS